MRNAYEAVKIALEKEEKVYNDFIDKGIDQYKEKLDKYISTIVIYLSDS